MFKKAQFFSFFFEYSFFFHKLLAVV